MKGITLQQAFYGHSGAGGYKLLGSSDPAISATVTKLCESVGSYDGESAVEAFYLNWSDGTRRYMIRGTLGKKDGARPTLFFNALVGRESVLRASRVGICGLIAAGAFRDSFPGGALAAAEFAPGAAQAPFPPSPFPWNGENLAIVSAVPELDCIRGLLRDKLDAVNWASFTFAPLRDFRIYVISQNTGRPGDRLCVTPSGIRLAPSPRPKPVETTPATPSAPATTILAPKSRGIVGKMLAASLLVNAVLLYCVFVFQPHGVDIEKIKAETRQKTLEELRKAFGSDLVPFMVVATQLVPNARTQLDAGEGPDHASLLHLKRYIDFVNKEIFNQTEEQ